MYLLIRRRQSTKRSQNCVDRGKFIFASASEAICSRFLLQTFPLSEMYFLLQIAKSFLCAIYITSNLASFPPCNFNQIILHRKEYDIIIHWGIEICEKFKKFPLLSHCVSDTLQVCCASFLALFTIQRDLVVLQPLKGKLLYFEAKN